jgi:hypothetical protein
VLRGSNSIFESMQPVGFPLRSGEPLAQLPDFFVGKEQSVLDVCELAPRNCCLVLCGFLCGVRLLESPLRERAFGCAGVGCLLIPLSHFDARPQIVIRGIGILELSLEMLI